MDLHTSMIKVTSLTVIISCCVITVPALDLAYLNKHCGRSVKVEDAVQLKLTSMLAYTPNVECSSVLYNEDKYQMMVQFLHVDIQNSTHCREAKIELYKEPHADGFPDVVVCGSHVPDKTYVVSREGMVASFVSSDEAAFEGFDLLVTPFHTGLCDAESEFQCDNKRCIADSLACNGLNNCGDSSDEKYNCGLSTQFIVAVALVSVAVGCLLIFAAFVFASRKCKHDAYVRVL